MIWPRQSLISLWCDVRVRTLLLLVLFFWGSLLLPSFLHLSLHLGREHLMQIKVIMRFTSPTILMYLWELKPGSSPLASPQLSLTIWIELLDSHHSHSAYYIQLRKGFMFLLLAVAYLMPCESWIMLTSGVEGWDQSKFSLRINSYTLDLAELY